jgi:hypothetical protein
MSDNTVANFVYASLAVAVISIQVGSYLLSQYSTPPNKLYNINLRYILLYSVGASLLLYGMALYFFSAFPELAPMYLLLLAGLLSSLTLTCMYFIPWKVHAKAEGASGVNATHPAFLGYSISLGVSLAIGAYLLLAFKAMQNRLQFLLLVNAAIIPFLFLSSFTINTVAFNNFTNMFN